MSAATVKCKTCEERNRNGQFKMGNNGGPGNPYSRTVAELRANLNQCITMPMVEQVINKIFHLALEGNIPAARLFLQYAVGKPEDPANRDQSSVDACEPVMDKQPACETVADRAATHGPAPAIPAELVQTVRCEEIIASECAPRPEQTTRGDQTVQKPSSPLRSNGSREGGGLAVEECGHERTPYEPR